MTMLMHQKKPLQRVLDRTSPVTVTKNCRHCKISFAPHPADTGDFCCRGCAGAWEIVHGLGLETFYRMNTASPLKPVSSFASQTIATRDYQVFDAPEFQQEFTTAITADQSSHQASSQSSLQATVHKRSKLLIEGITCYACIWLIRQALQRRFAPDPSSSDPKQPAAASITMTITIDINQSTGTSTLTWSPNLAPLSEIVAFIESLGYQVLPQRGAPTNEPSTLIRTGVGLFVMMNVMSFALAEYLAGADGLDAGLQGFLRWLSAALTTIALAYTGREFFSNTWRALRAKAPTIDAPILVGLLAAYVWSLKNTIQGTGHVYYDSICAIVALVITGRLVQQNILRRNQTRMAALINPRDGWILTKPADDPSADWQPKRASAVQRGDMVRVLPGDIVPLRTTCAVSCAEISFEQLKGETDWKTIHHGQTIPAGALNGSTPLDAIAVQNGAESYMHSLSRVIEQAIHDKGHYHQWSDQASWWLFIAVFAAAGVVFAVMAPHDLPEAMRRVVALLLVACPCTFAIGVPLTFGTAMTHALREGILFKSQRSLEKLADVTTFIFDKTGTLTQGVQSVQSWTWNPDISLEEQAQILAQLTTLDQVSSHHIATSVARFARLQHNPTAPTSDHTRPEDVEETQGLGIACRYGASTLRLGRPSFALPSGFEPFLHDAKTVVSLNGKLIATITFDDQTRGEAWQTMDALRDLGQDLHILSGDSTQRTQQTATLMKLHPGQSHGQATPASKTMYVRTTKKQGPVAMVGNGLNDAGAMSQADISFAVAGSASTAMNSADICLLSEDLTLTVRSLNYARQTMRRTHLVFGLAFIYNVLGLALAATGHVTPVLAAILMPISSLTVTHVATSFRLRMDGPVNQSVEA